MAISKSILGATLASAVALAMATPALAKGGSSHDRGNARQAHGASNANPGRSIRELHRIGRQADERASWKGRHHANPNAGFEDDCESP